MRSFIRISLKNIHKKFGSKDILKNFNLELSTGIYCLKGKNGSGKSTLLRMVGGLDNDYVGSISYSSWQREELNHYRSYLFDTPQTYPFIRGREFIDFVSKVRKINPEIYIKRFWIDFGLEEFIHLKFDEMSLGQKKKLFSVVTLIDECPLWVLDEPTSALDEKAIYTLKNKVIRHGKTGIVLMAEHNESFIKGLDVCEVRL